MSKAPLAFVGSRTKSAYEWERRQSTDEWVEENVRLSKEASPITGPVRLQKTPHLRKMFSVYDDSLVWKIIGRFSTQTAKTFFMQCCMAKRLATRPAKMQWAIPNEKDVTTYIEDKMDPFIRGVKKLKEKVEDHKQKEKERLKRSRIKVAGGDCVFTGTSPTSKRSKTVVELFADEADLFSDGSFTELEGRTKASEKYGRKVVAMSSRKTKNGEISKAYDSCETKMEWHTPCPECGHHWLAGSKDLKWMTPKEYRAKHGIADDVQLALNDYKFEALKDVYVECPECGHHIDSLMKDRMILDDLYDWYVVEGPERGKSVGFRGNALAMFFTRFETIAELIINAEALGTFDDMAQIYMDYFEEIYEPESEENTDKNDLLLLSNGFRAESVPNDTCMMYLTVDTQKDGFWFKVTAFQYGFIANTVMHGFVETFDELEILMGMKFFDANGDSYIVDKTFIDRMGIKERTIEVDAWVAHLIAEHGMEGRIFPTMGVDRDPSGRAWYKTTIVKDLATEERRKTPIEAVRVNNLVVKNELNRMIQRSIKKAKGEEGSEEYRTKLYYINQTIVDDAAARERSISTDYERQMSSEEYVYKVDQKTGKVAKEKSWEKRTSTIDNHLWDCSVLAVAAALMDNVMLMQKPSENAFNDLVSSLLD